MFSIKDVIREAKIFCETESKKSHNDILGITDGKAVGTYVERLFKEYLKSKYNDINLGNSAIGIDLPDINTDIKVTSIRQPQSSCHFKNAEQKIFGLGYNLLVFVYDKVEKINICNLHFKYCSFIPSDRTSDFTMTKRLIEMKKDGANIEDIIGFLSDRNIPADDIGYNRIADKILNSDIKQGYLTISNALQWRIQYSNVIKLNNKVDGIINYEWN